MRKLFFGVCLLTGTLLTANVQAADDLYMCIHENGEVSIEACNRAINSGRYSGVDLANAYINRGVEMIAKGEFDRAISDETTAIKLFPKSTLAYSNRGSAYQKKGDLDRALADFTTAIDYDPENPGAYNNRASVRENKGDRAGAIADLKRALACKPRPGKFFNVEAHFKWARDELNRLAKNP